jgi:hypothetical protein
MHGFAAAREREAQRVALKSAFERDRVAMSYATWENKTAANQKKIEMQKRMGLRKKEYDKRLNVRRRQLSALLSEENRRMNDELAASFETMEQRRERLVREASKLQEQREKDRLAEVERLRALQWRDSVDEIRTYQSNQLTVRVAQERKQQLIWKKEREEAVRAADRRAEEEYARRKVKLLRRELAEKAVVDERADLTKRMLAAQLVERDKLRRRQKEEDDAELARMRAKWAADNQREEDKIQARKEREARIAMETSIFNQHKKELDSHRGDAEREEDERLLRAVLAKEAAKAKEEADLKAARKKEMVDYQDILKEMMIKETQDDSYLERLLQEEADKEWAKREAKWNAEAEARQQLMREVDASRQTQMAHKARRRAKQKEEDDAFTRDMFARNDVAMEAERDKQRKKKADRIKAADFITAQIEDNKQRKIAYQRELDEHVRMEREAHALYGKKIEKLYELKLGVPNHRRKKVQWYY